MSEIDIKNLCIGKSEFIQRTQHENVIFVYNRSGKLLLSLYSLTNYVK